VLLGVPPVQQGLSAWPAARLVPLVMPARSIPQPGARRASPALLEATATPAKQCVPSAPLARTPPFPEVRPAPPVMPERTTPRPEAALYHPACLVTLGHSVPPLLLRSAHLALPVHTAPTTVPQKDFRAMRATFALQDHPSKPRVRKAASARRMRALRRLALKIPTANRANWHPRRSARPALPAKSLVLELWRVRRPASRTP
jgi:hypothetical protein